MSKSPQTGLAKSTSPSADPPFRPGQSTINPEWTFLYSGSSGDQLLPILDSLVNFWEDSDCLGDSQLVVWNVGSRLMGGSYLTVLPNSRLDCHGHANMYAVDAIESLFQPYQEELIRLYYQFVHPAYPIIGCRESFGARRKAGCVPGCLLAVVYLHGTTFWKLSPLACQLTGPHVTPNVRSYIFSSLTSECRTPNLAVVQAALLFMQLPAPDNEPSFTGIWGLVTMVVGMAQDIGLHVDPGDWSITLEERGMRRIVWWAVFVHDVWMAHWLGRPPHITRNNWNVSPLAREDFSSGAGSPTAEIASGECSFIALCNLSILLSEVLEAFYSIRSSFHNMSTSEALSRGRLILNRLQRWSQTSLPANPTLPHEYALILASCAVYLSIHRAWYGASSKQRHEEARGLIVESIICNIRHRFLPILSAIKNTLPFGLWLIYIKGSLAIAGSLLIAILVSSDDHMSLRKRHELLLDFRDCLRELEAHYASSAANSSFTRLPLRRLDVLIEQLLGDGDV